MNTVIVSQYKDLERLPPTMSLLLVLKAIGRDVVYIGTPSKAGHDFLEKNHVPYYFMPDYRTSINHGKTVFAKVLRRFKRLYAFCVQRRWIRNTLSQIIKRKGNVTIWHSEVASAALIGDWGLKLGPRVITIYEIFDFRGGRWWGFTLKKHLLSSRLVVPEYNRSFLLKETLGLSTRPAVIPNKPFVHPRTVRLPISDGYIKSVISKIGNRPIFLYQGVWTQDREDVTKVVEIIAKNRPQYCIVCMPECGQAKQLAKKYANVFTVPFVPAPSHLVVTSWATVGMAIYNVWGESLLTRLNVVYCAPNKIYEYAGFGIPTLGSNLPGLKYTISRYNAGVCCDLDDKSIIDAADELISNLSRYQVCATRFFDSFDLKVAVRDVLDSAET